MFGLKGKPQIDRKMLADKADALDKTIREMSAMRMVCATRRSVRRQVISGVPNISAVGAGRCHGGHPSRGKASRKKWPR